MTSQSVNPYDGKLLSRLGIQEFVNKKLVRVADIHAPAWQGGVSRHA